ncbi:MAG: DUF4345 domain-containing protein [Rhizobium sp.]|nr:DUF4345 domain-containing protein [Rhizobium sp.]
MTVILKAILALAGLGIVFLGLNIGFGGIQTLGLQGNGAFIEVTDPSLFSIRDSHVRFIGGVWLGVGLLFVAAAFRLHQLRGAVLAAIGMIFIGGLARFSAPSLVPLAGADLLPSLLAELLLFPLLGLWIVKATPRTVA